MTPSISSVAGATTRFFADNYTLTGVTFYLAGILFVGELAIRPLLGLTLSDLFFFLALIAVVVEAVMRREPLQLRVPWILVLGVALFTVGGLASSYYSIHRRASLVALVKLDYVLLV